MNEGKIHLKIDAFGRPTIEGVGFVGTACTSATAGIERALQGADGDKVVTLKPEFHETETEQQHLTQAW